MGPLRLLLFCATLAALAAPVLHAAEGGALEKFAFEKAEMGMPFRITLHARDEKVARAAADAAFARIAALNRVFSDYEDDSELVLLSRSSGSGRAVKVSDELWTVLHRAQTLAARTDGAFDATCGPLTALWRRARRKMELPAPDLVAEMLSRTGWRKMRLDEKARTVELLAPDMRLDVGSIAKGFACDEALRTLRAAGCPSAMVAGSGDISVGDAPPGRKGWRIEVVALDTENPAQPAKPIVIELANAAIATSGDRNQRLEIGGRRYSHILDPRTGQPMQDHALVSVIAKDGFTAGISTACSVIGPPEALKLAAEWKAEIRIQRMPGRTLEVTESAGWSKFLAAPAAAHGE